MEGDIPLHPLNSKCGPRACREGCELTNPCTDTDDEDDRMLIPRVLPVVFRQRHERAAHNNVFDLVARGSVKVRLRN